MCILKAISPSFEITQCIYPIKHITLALFLLRQNTKGMLDKGIQLVLFEQTIIGRTYLKEYDSLKPNFKLNSSLKLSLCAVGIGVGGCKFVGLPTERRNIFWIISLLSLPWNLSRWELLNRDKLTRVGLITSTFGYEQWSQSSDKGILLFASHIRIPKLRRYFCS